jgi:AcrR family transcriptional regulator
VPYHHGELRAALLDAGIALARTGGPNAVVLRAATRTAGVSHNAAYRHFEDRSALLRAVCERCMSELALLIERRCDDVPVTDSQVADAWLRLEATGRAYIEFALTETGWFRTAFAVPTGLEYFASDEGVGRSGLGPYGLLSTRLDELVTLGALPSEQRPGAEYAAWSAVHGLSSLLIDGPLRDLSDAERAVAIDRVVTGVVDGL